MAYIKLDLTKCPICNQTMFDPKCLICYHTFCSSCIKILFEKNDILECPVCSHVQKVKDPLKISDNIFIRKLAHLIINLEDSNRDNFYENCKFDFCSSHKEQPLEILCSDCNLIICLACYLEMHHTHKFIKLSDNTDLDASIHSSLNKIDGLHQNLSNESELVERKKSNLLNMKRKIEDQINNLKDDLIERIVGNSSELHHQLENHFSSNLKLINKINDDLSAKLKECDFHKTKILKAIDLNDYHYLINIPQLNMTFNKNVNLDFSEIFLHKTPDLYKSSNFIGYLSETESTRKGIIIEKPILCFHLISNIKYLPSTTTIMYDALQNDVGIIASLFPFSEINNYFEIEILNIGKRGAIVVGIVYKHYEHSHQPGWLHNSWGYHAEDGCVYSNGLVLATHEKCAEKDSLGCGVTKVNAGFNVYFTKNKSKFGDYFVGNHLDGAYPAVGMHSRGESAIFKESLPWQEGDSVRL